MNREELRTLKCYVCNRSNLPVGIIAFTRGEYKVYCIDCLKDITTREITSSLPILSLKNKLRNYAITQLYMT